MKILDCDQRSPEWFAARMGRPTASCASKILTSTGKKSAQWKTYLYELVAERAGHANTFMELTDAMLEGIRREDESRAAYVFQTGRNVKEVGLILSDVTGASASPDGLSDTCGVELKNPNPGTFFKELDSGKVPAGYLPQIHMSMAVSDGEIALWDYCCYISGETPLIIPVERNAYTETMNQAIADFGGELDKTCIRLGVPLLDQLSEAA